MPLYPGKYKCGKSKEYDSNLEMVTRIIKKIIFMNETFVIQCYL